MIYEIAFRQQTLCIFVGGYTGIFMLGTTEEKSKDVAKIPATSAIFIRPQGTTAVASKRPGIAQHFITRFFWGGLILLV